MFEFKVLLNKVIRLLQAVTSRDVPEYTSTPWILNNVQSLACFFVVWFSTVSRLKLSSAETSQC